MIKHIFFDFDGVLAESVNVKTEAFRQLYLPFGKEVSDQVVEYHLGNGGVSRFDKIRYYHSNLLGIQLSPEELNRWAEKFAELVVQGVILAPEVKGTIEFLQLHSKTYDSFIITGTPTEEIRYILKERGWGSFFKGAFGSPEKKIHWTEYLINTYQFKRSECVFVGDATTDYDAAYKSGIHFILRYTEENAPYFEEYKGPRICDLTELKYNIDLL